MPRFPHPSLPPDRLRHVLLWVVSLGLSLLFTAGIVVEWHGAGRHDVADTVVGTVVTREREVDPVVAQYFPDGNPVVRIPTGVMLNSIEFVNAYNVKVAGYLWQRRIPRLPDDVGHGVIFPEAEEQRAAAKPTTVFKVFNYTIESYAFNVTLRQTFDYRNYPLDHQDVWLRMRSADVQNPIQLVPDFLGYPAWRPDRLQGLDPSFVLGDWQPDYTAFSMLHRDSGLSANIAGFRGADLYFNLGVDRNLAGPLIGRIVPVLLLALLLFLSLFVITTDPDRRTISGFTAFAIIGFAVSTVLVVAVNDNAARTETGSTGIAYIECWYFALYLLTLLVALNATLLITGGLRRLVTWRENLLPKLLFWPLFTGVMYVAALGFLGH
ncbi:hypothetical protein GZH49_29050 [Nocardia terpenica]|uniref:hypothetical protein n=1 Tax=Nocardia terpenica TaxID=455432 RepID=UPI002FE42959